MKKTKLKWSEMNKKQRILFVIDWVLRGLLIFIFALLVGAFVFSCFGNSSEASAYADDGSSGQVVSTFSSSANTAYDETGLELYNINLLYCPDYKITKSGITAGCTNGVFYFYGTATADVSFNISDPSSTLNISNTTICYYNESIESGISFGYVTLDGFSVSVGSFDKIDRTTGFVNQGDVDSLFVSFESGYSVVGFRISPMLIYKYRTMIPFQPNLKCIFDDGFNMGYDDGYADGAAGGSGSGGYDQGYSDGYEAGTTAGYDQGYEEGYTDGINSASGSGDYDDGFTDGYNTANSFIPLYNFSSCELTLLNSTTQQTSSDPYTFINSSYVNGSLDNQISFRLTFPSYLSPNIMFTIRWKNPLAYYDNGSIDIEIAPNINLSFYNDSNLLGNVALDWVRSDFNGVVYYSVDRKFSSGVTSVVISMQASSLSFDDFEVGYKGEYTYDVGYQSGFDKGQSLGYENGYNAGHSLGYQEGFDSSGAGGFSWLISSVQSFLDTKFFGDFGIGTLLYVGLGIALCSLFIKFFAGG